MPLRNEPQLSKGSFGEKSLSRKLTRSYGYFGLGHVVAGVLQIGLRVDENVDALALRIAQNEVICQRHTHRQSACRGEYVSPGYPAYEVYKYHYADKNEGRAEVRLHHYKDRRNSTVHSGLYYITQSPEFAFFVHAVANVF